MNRLRELRLEHKERQIDLSVGVDIDTQDISRYERGVTAPSLKRLIRFADYYNVSSHDEIAGEYAVDVMAIMTNILSRISKERVDR